MSNENKKLFGTSGIRGKVEGEVTAALALNVGKALSTYLGGKGNVVVGYDTRTTNLMLENAICSGLLESGCNVLKLGMVPTPLVGYATNKLNADAGVMITASHNPSEYNGIKLWNNNGMAYTPSQEEKIEIIFHSKKFNNTGWENVGNIYHIEEVIGDYIDEIIAIVDIKSTLKVVVDSASGAGSELSPIIFRKAGCDVITLNSQSDGFFPGRNPEPNEANLKNLQKVVLATNADIGIAHDGDADRMITVDEKGRVSEFDKLLALISKNFGGKIITTVDAGLCIDDALSKVGGEVVRTKVGDVNVAEAIIEENATFGGEPSGTWIHPDFCMCPDGILSGLRIAEIVSKEGALSKLLDEIHDYPNIREKIICSKELKLKIMGNMDHLLKNAFDDIIDVNTIDGVRLTLNDGSWLLIRPSGTEDYIRITLEGKTQERAEFIRDTCVQIITDNLN
ncbi:phosphoglucosamine mutase [Methanobrevibacter cuticularis]|uniref:Probable phosphoglucosamine mutase n=1 Tax=Methanobrevibacter cuticularis TaxID=47311 RepID=A0A166DMJ4_9EURY|nr:phosphoglucosamine mutase [Methanobrevibacter cuticularis]KZX15760.1 phosphoglucosamine mutase [Methanobrevibacter cuticularis]